MTGLPHQHFFIGWRDTRGLRLPTVAAQSERLATEAARANQSHLNYLAELLGAEMEERERHTIERRIKEARLPRMKTLEDFDFSAASHISASRFTRCPRARIWRGPSQ